MAGGYDGTIRVDTSIDSKGFNKGTKSLGNSLSGLLKSITSVGKALLGIFVGGTIIGAIRGIVGSFDLMKSSIGESLKPVTDAMTTLKGSFVNLIATALIPLVPYIVMAVNWFTNLVGIVTQVVAALFGMQKTVGGITKEIKKTGKEAKGALAAFDQINVLQKNDAGSEVEAPNITPPVMDVPQSLFDKVQKLRQALLELWNDVKTGATEALAWFSSLGSFEGFLKLLGTIFLVVAGLFVFAKTVGLVLAVLQFFGVIMTGTVVLSVLAVVAVIFLWIAVLVYVIAHWEELSTTVYQAMFIIGSYIGNTLLSIMAFFEKLKTTVMQTVFVIQYYAGLAAASLKDGFSKSLDAIKEKFRTIFTDIKTFITTIINDIITIINNMIAGIVGGINAVLGGVNAISGTMGAAAIPSVSTPKIPHLATGAVIPPNAQFAAILGDQRSGKNIETPENLLRQIMREELGSGSGGEVTVTMPVYLDSEKIYEGQKKVKTRRGTSLITSGGF